jgi:4'-phosphopantetheinyl transferase
VFTTLAPGEVHVWYRSTEELDEAEIEAALALLSPDERSRHARFRFVRNQRDYAAAHALLRTSLSRYADVAPREWTFRELEHGKPAFLAGSRATDLAFNLTHTDGLVACAITSGADIGVDVESLDRSVGEGVARRFFSDRENLGLKRLPSIARARRFVDLWTLKESYLKATGQGISHDLAAIVFEIDDQGTIAFRPASDIDPSAWHFELFRLADRYRLAVAVQTIPGRSMTVTIHEQL